MRCTARSKRTGEQCGRHTAPGKRVCHIHGGKSRGGVLSGTFKVGRYSRYAPERLLPRYDESRDDPKKLEHWEEIALLDAYLADRLARVDTGESGHLWVQLGAAVTDLLNARRAGNDQRLADALNTIVQTVRAGKEDFLLWQEILGAMEQRGRTVEREQKRQIMAQQVVSLDELMVFTRRMVHELQQSARENISDVVERQRFLEDSAERIRRLVSADSG